MAVSPKQPAKLTALEVIECDFELRPASRQSKKLLSIREKPPFAVTKNHTRHLKYNVIQIRVAVTGIRYVAHFGTSLVCEIQLD
jgi:hypothetical protein